jgi:hypothetical protein
VRVRISSSGLLFFDVLRRFDGNGSFRSFVVSAGLLHDTVDVLIFGDHVVL